ncbi:PulJ/GspJ family protein [Sporosarcina luteola]|uniref:PulJ/GspJ family protein n=1 Tax=Sporosarcina luteola TaxID=582850 RepID=UPI00203DF2B8|nr:type II secretion system protein [Sporosarcina luteola]MCM3710754.1 type II secretion system GspH family protein [Sporosarcina luteola]
MRGHEVNEKGMTLVEILAALVILGIVFVGFMSIFPQMTNFNEKTEMKLKSMNEARVLLDSFQKSYTSNEFKSAFTSEKGYSLINKKEWVRTDGRIEYRIKKDATLEAGDAKGEKSLHEIHISIQKDGKVISKTFGYIEVVN